MKVLDFEMCRKSSKSINACEYYDWICDAFEHKSDYYMPVKSRITQEDGNYYAIMPVMNEKDNLAAVKMIGRHSLKEGENRSVMMSDMLLYEADTGVLKAVMDTEFITTLRTGACAAHAALLYGKSDFQTVALFGLGNIMTVFADVLLAKVPDRKIVFKLYKHNNHEIRFMEHLKGYENVSFELCDTYADTIRDADVVVSAITRATENFAADELYKPGCTVIPIMTLGFQNCDLFFDKVFSDELEQIKGFKYYEQFKKKTNTFDVMKGNAPGRENDEERILVYNYGLAIFDLYFAKKYVELSDSIARDVEYDYCKENFFMY